MQIYIALKLDWVCQPYSGGYNHTSTSGVHTSLKLCVIYKRFN